MRTMIVAIQVEDDADMYDVAEQANAMWNPRDEEETEAVVYEDATAFVKDQGEEFARTVFLPHPHERTMTFAYGGRECCETEPAYRITRTNSTGTSRILACSDHHAEATTTNAGYVHGWGDVTTHVHKIERGEDPRG